MQAGSEFPCKSALKVWVIVGGFSHGKLQPQHCQSQENHGIVGNSDDNSLQLLSLENASELG